MMNNVFLINAPAGSGKTTQIRNMLKAISVETPSKKVLCITYTNRAADELKKDLNNSSFVVSTIHSYINDLISPFFSDKQIIDLYWSIFEKRIETRIKNVSKDEKIEASNQRYREKFGDLSKETVKENLNKISYGETQFTSLYTGRLSHDDLLMFSYEISLKYPIVLKKIYGKFDYIFIDEYQDTSAFVLKLFYTAVQNRNSTKLYLLGDRMQQIYRNYDGSFEEEFKTFDTSFKLKINHRSSPKIISILNNIYNDSDYEQQPSEKNKILTPDIQPQIIITQNPKHTVGEIQKLLPEILTLYLMNKEKYAEIGAINLYNCFDSMETYSFGRKYSPTDVLSDLSDDNPDPLMKLLFSIYKIISLYNEKNYGTIISMCKKLKGFNNKLFKIHKHEDKAFLKEKLEQLTKTYRDKESKIGDVIEQLKKQEIIDDKKITALLDNEEYTTVFDVSTQELQNLAEYLNTPTISTQHGVKGESHTSVIFVANDSYSKPNVRMYDFFSVWSSVNFSLIDFENFYYSYIEDIIALEKNLGMKTDELTADTHNNNEINQKILKDATNLLLEKYKSNLIFGAVCKSDYDLYLNKPNVGNAKKLFKISKVEGMLTAYKLFYVGCSRARKNIIIVIDEAKIAKYKDAFIQKARSVGFAIDDKSSIHGNDS